jgi:hypothetical protein
MNPLKWRREHQVALVLGALIGVAVGLAIGFIYNGVHYVTLFPWLAGGSALRWGVFGALVGGATIYMRQLLHD